MNIVGIAAILVCSLWADVGHCAEPRWGADMSFTSKLEYFGATYTRADSGRDALELMRGAGVDVLRLRLWHTPAEPWHGTDSVLALARRGRDLGFKLLLDLHYSDTWADPMHQDPPASWRSLSFAQLEDSVYRYTNDVVRRFRDAHVPLDEIQIGNEIGAGMLWNFGRVGGVFDTPQQWQQLTDLLKAGVRGVRDSLPQSDRPLIVIHHQEGGDSAACRWFFDRLVSADVPFDVIGLSYYPWWHGSLNALSANVAMLGNRYGRSVQIVETAYPYTASWCDEEANIVGGDTPILPAFPASELGQAFYLGNLRDRIAAIAGLENPLICLWEPAWIPTESFTSPWENLALFDCDGQALAALGVFGGLAPQGLTIFAEGDNIHLRWEDDANFFYHIYAVDPAGNAPPARIGSTAAHEYLMVNEATHYERRSYFVRGATTP